MLQKEIWAAIVGLVMLVAVTYYLSEILPRRRARRFHRKHISALRDTDLSPRD